MNCDVGEATEGLENELWRRWSDGKVGEWAVLIVIVIAELILQPSRRITYVTTAFSNTSVALPTSQALHLIHLASHHGVSKSSGTSAHEKPKTQEPQLIVKTYVILFRTMDRDGRKGGIRGIYPLRNFVKNNDWAISWFYCCCIIWHIITNFQVI